MPKRFDLETFRDPNHHGFLDMAPTPTHHIHDIRTRNEIVLGHPMLGVPVPQGPSGDSTFKKSKIPKGFIKTIKPKGHIKRDKHGTPIFEKTVLHKSSHNTHKSTPDVIPVGRLPKGLRPVRRVGPVIDTSNTMPVRNLKTKLAASGF